jgi:hypothetical protein
LWLSKMKGYVIIITVTSYFRESHRAQIKLNGKDTKEIYYLNCVDMLRLFSFTPATSIHPIQP